MFVFRNRRFRNVSEYASLEIARVQFAYAQFRLFNVNNWSDLGGFTANFMVYDPLYLHKTTMLEIGSYIKITFPFSLPENWVKVTEIYSDASEAFFVVHPTFNPHSNERKVVAHFLKKQASSTFKIQLKSTSVVGYEIGCNEVINNQNPQVGNRKIINTIMAWVGWLGLQNYQWGKLTKYLVRTEFEYK